jgi:glycosyltransferase involved in cell wall biosynthesis
MAKELGIGDRVTFTGKIAHAAVPEHVATMDIGVMPESNLFGSPMKIFEYMAMGVAPVGPRYVPLEEAIDDGENGLIFDPRSVDDLARCLRTLAGDAEYRRRLGRAAREQVLAKHLWVHNAQAVLDLIERQRAMSAAGARITKWPHKELSEEHNQG